MIVEEMLSATARDDWQKTLAERGWRQCRSGGLGPGLESDCGRLWRSERAFGDLRKATTHSRHSRARLHPHTSSFNYDHRYLLMPSTNAQTHNCRAGPSTHSQSASLGKKRKYQLLSDVFDDSNIGDTEDKGRKTTTKPTRKIKPNRAQKGVKDYYRSSRELCAHALMSTDSSKRSRSASPAKQRRRLLSSHGSEEHDMQGKEVRNIKKIKKIKKAPKGDLSQSYEEPHHGILRKVAKPESSQGLLSTSITTTYKQRPLPDIYGDDLDKHAAQDKMILDSMKSEGIPVDAIDPIPLSLLYGLILDVVALAEEKDPDVPLKSTATAIFGALKDEKFREVVHRCYCIKSFKDIRNHPLLRKSKVRFDVGQE